MNDSSPLLEVKNLTKRFGGLIAVDKANFEVKQGEILGVVGTNGSGKTTLINMISGFLRPDDGIVKLEGEQISGLPAHKVAEKGIARTFQVLRPFYNVVACHNVVLSLLSPRSKKIRHIRRVGLAEQIAMDLMELLGFDRGHDSFRLTRTMPPGYLRRLDIARAIAGEPKLLLADEPFSGLSPTEAVSVGPALLKLNSQGMAILIVEHRLHYIMNIVHRVIGMFEGRIVVEGTPEVVMQEKSLREIYYG
jgi:branched-chain amino acid transport system ATP-binding protein